MASPDDLESDEFTDLGEDSELDALDGLDLDEEEDDIDDVDYESDDEGGDDADEGDSEKGGEESSDDDDHDDAELDDEDPDEEEESLDVILAREQDLEDEFAPSGEAPRSSPTTTPPGEDEFTCRSCFLVKRRAQLADEDELICLDCA